MRGFFVLNEYEIGHQCQLWTNLRFDCTYFTYNSTSRITKTLFECIQHKVTYVGVTEQNNQWKYQFEYTHYAHEYEKSKLIFGYFIRHIKPIIIHYPTIGIPTHEVGILILWISTGISIWSGYKYIVSYFCNLSRNMSRKM